MLPLGNPRAGAVTTNGLTPWYQASLNTFAPFGTSTECSRFRTSKPPSTRRTPRRGLLATSNKPRSPSRSHLLGTGGPWPTPPQPAVRTSQMMHLSVPPGWGRGSPFSFLFSSAASHGSARSVTNSGLQSEATGGWRRVRPFSPLPSSRIGFVIVVGLYRFHGPACPSSRTRLPIGPQRLAAARRRNARGSHRRLGSRPRSTGTRRRGTCAPKYRPETSNDASRGPRVGSRAGALRMALSAVMWMRLSRAPVEFVPPPFGISDLERTAEETNCHKRTTHTSDRPP